MYYFLSGMPRAGSTLLAAILNQNPDIHVSTSSPVVHLMWQLQTYLSTDDFYHSYPKPKFQQTLISSVIDTYYQDNQERYIIDKNRTWSGSLNLVTKYITDQPKILCPVRKTSEILQSFLKLMQQYPGNMIDENIKPPYTLQKRCDYLLSTNSVLMASVHQILNAPKNIIHFIDYDELLSHPKETIDSVYRFLGIPHYTHSFTAIENQIQEDDTVYGMPTMHTVKSSLVKTVHEIQLPDDVLKKCDKIDIAIRYQMNEEHSYPSLPEQGKNLAKFTFQLVKKALQGGALVVSQEVKEQRLEVCRTCEWYDPEQVRCKHCGCFLEEKATFALDSCPIGKWTESAEDWENGRFDELVKELEEFNSPSKEVETVEDNNELPLSDFPPNPEMGDECVLHDVKWKWNGIHWEYIPE